jgi:Gpi18-like mannosyltransferase
MDQKSRAETLVLLLLTLGYCGFQLFLAPLGGFKTDIETLVAWTYFTLQHGVGYGTYQAASWDFGKSPFILNHGPMYLYFVYFLGRLLGIRPELGSGWFLDLSSNISPLLVLLVKIPTIIANLVTSLYLFYLVRQRRGFRCGLFSYLMYALNPGIIMASFIWGQTDAIQSLFLLLAVVLISKGSIRLSGVFAAASVLTKQHSLVLMPFLALFITRRLGARKLVSWLVSGAIAFLVMTIPFWPNMYDFVYIVYVGLPGDWRMATTSYGVLNIWTLLLKGGPEGLGWNVFPDGSFFWIGAGIFSAVYAVILAVILSTRSPDDEYSVLWGSFLIWLAFYLFPTRIHDRWLFPGLVFLLLYATLTQSRRSLALYGILSFTFFMDIGYELFVAGAYSSTSGSVFDPIKFYLVPVFAIWHTPLSFGHTMGVFLSIANIAVFLVAITFSLARYRPAIRRILARIAPSLSADVKDHPSSSSNSATQ